VYWPVSIESAVVSVQIVPDQMSSTTNTVGGIGVQGGGAFAVYFVADSRNSCILPDAIDFVSAAPLACAGITVWRGLLEAKLSKGQTIGIVDSGGGLGHLLIAFAKARGLKVVGVDARDERPQLLREPVQTPCLTLARG
jgi:propanol-preferring alcohol dehydrogenase